MAKWLLAFCRRIVAPADKPGGEIDASNFAWRDFAGDEYLETHWVAVLENGCYSFRRNHFDFFTIVLTDQDDFCIRNTKLNADQYLHTSPLQLACPLVCRCVIWNHGNCVNAANLSASHFEAVFADGCLLVFIGDVDEGDHGMSSLTPKLTGGEAVRVELRIRRNDK